MKPKIQYLILILILVLGFTVRLYKIQNPVADWHSWRQADTAMVTRNFVKLGIDILHPRFDDFSDTSGHGLFNPQGYRFVEFPIFNLIHYLLYTLVPSPYSLEVWGRLTSVFAALTSGIILFFIVRRRTNPTIGLLSSFFYLLLPFNIYFTRVILPDPLMVTLFLAALNFNDLKRKNLTLLFGSLAILVKPIAIFFLLPVFINNFWLGVVMLLPFGLWRLWSHRFPEGIPASLWLLNGNHIRFRPAFFRWIFGERIAILILGKWGLWPFLHGVFSTLGNFGPWVISALLYLFTFASGNVHHDYYQIPIIPVIAILLSLGTWHLWHITTRTWLNRIVLIFSLVIMFGLSWYDIKGLFQVNNGSILAAGEAVDKLLPKDALIVAPYNGDTAFLYATKRRGFTHLPLPIKDLIDRYNIQYYVSVTYDRDTRAIMDKYTVLVEKPEYAIIKLVEPLP
ncbi:MAG: hypothetical protein G01um101416_32 [Microgenomates group bacterium Gr01-1014_16]|nr:MAG: hypothetical protein G01um101416_32 [Microgenomates group bacterium Gr01-1014_16]